MGKEAKTLLEQTRELAQIEQSWQDFANQVLGQDGILLREHPSPEQRAAFKKTDDYKEICEIIARAVEITNGKQVNTQVVTLRLPVGLHAALRSEAHERNTSMQKLLFALILQPIDQSLVPQDC